MLPTVTMRDLHKSRVTSVEKKYNSTFCFIYIVYNIESVKWKAWLEYSNIFVYTYNYIANDSGGLEE